MDRDVFRSSRMMNASFWFIAAAAVSFFAVPACSQQDTLDVVKPPVQRTEMAMQMDMPMSMAAQPGTPMAGMAMSGESMDHSHMPIVVPEGAPIPAISLTVQRDVMSGYNLELHTERYDLVPPPGAPARMEDLMGVSINPETGFVQGHAHLYVNGVKIQRIYSDYVYLPDTLFKPGLNQINVSLNNDAHMYWTSGERQILASMFIDTRAERLVQHNFSSFPVAEVKETIRCAPKMEMMTD